MENKNKTLVAVLLISLATVVSIGLIQINAQSSIYEKCSYLDPITIDLLALSAAIFLIADGLYSINLNKNLPLKKHFSRVIRVALGFSILTLHVIQFLHK